MDSKIFIGKILTVFLAVLLAGCQKEDPETIVFIGDSIIARWDISKEFPVYDIQNKGSSGARLDYIGSLSGRMKGKTVVLLIGTNDSDKWNDAYIEKYGEYVRGLAAREVIVISVLPRLFEGDRPTINDDISVLNNGLMSMSSLNGWKFLDVYPLFIDGEEIKWNYYSDGLHLSDNGYEILGEQIRNVL